MLNKVKIYLEKNKKIILIISVFAVLLTLIFVVKSFDSTEKQDLNIISLKNDENENIEDSSTSSYDEYTIVIHITGEVKNEGIIKIPEGGRISDAIDKAGGLTEDADINRINLAYELEDGQKIYIPSKKDKNVENYISDGVDSIVLPEESESTSKTSLININKASLEELQTLNGIGESLAESIITYRTENGKFKNIEDIKNVAGIGDSKYEKIKDNIKVK